MDAPVSNARNFLTRYIPSRASCPLQRLRSGEASCIRSYYSDLWLGSGGIAAADAIGVHGVHKSDFMLTEADVNRMVNALASTSDVETLSSTKSTAPPHDMGIVIVWKSLMSACFAAAQGGSLLDLLHLTNEYHSFTEQPFVVGEIHSTEANVLEVRIYISHLAHHTRAALIMHSHFVQNLSQWLVTRNINAGLAPTPSPRHAWMPTFVHTFHILLILRFTRLPIPFVYAVVPSELASFLVTCFLRERGGGGLHPLRQCQLVIIRRIPLLGSKCTPWCNHYSRSCHLPCR